MTATSIRCGAAETSGTQGRSSRRSRLGLTGTMIPGKPPVTVLWKMRPPNLRRSSLAPTKAIAVGFMIWATLWRGAGWSVMTSGPQ